MPPARPNCATAAFRPGYRSIPAAKFRHPAELNGATKAALNSPLNELRTQHRSRRKWDQLCDSPNAENVDAASTFADPLKPMNNQADHDFFTNGYLMVISVIQGTTFAALILVADKLSASDLWRFSPYILYSFIMLVGLLYGYLVGSRDLKWPMDGFDVLIPVLLGVFQCAALLSLASKQPQPEFLWFVWYSLVLVTLMGTVINAWIKTAIHDKKNYHKHTTDLLRGLIGMIVSLILAMTPVVAYKCGWWKPRFVCTIIWILVGIRIFVFFGFCRRDWRMQKDKPRATV
jgi:uncharacterized protein YacL